MGQIQYRIAQYHHQLLVLAAETAGQRLITDFSNHSLPYPLPELRLGCPELLLVLTDYKGGVLFSFLLVFRSFQHGRIKELVPAAIAGCNGDSLTIKLSWSNWCKQPIGFYNLIRIGPGPCQDFFFQGFQQPIA